MRRFFRTLVIVLVAVSLSTGQPQPKISLVVSPGAPGTISVTRLTHCFDQLAREWKVPVEELPHVVVFHVSRAVADTAFISEDVAIRRNTSGRSGEAYYEVWLVGEPRFNYVVGLQNVIEYHFNLKPTTEERTAVVVRVARMEDAIVSVAEGK